MGDRGELTKTHAIHLAPTVTTFGGSALLLDIQIDQTTTRSLGTNGCAIIRKVIGVQVIWSRV